jgi:hypothetical protein
MIKLRIVITTLNFLTMKIRIAASFLSLYLILLMSCSKEKPMQKIIDNSLDLAVNQYTLMADVMKDKSDLLPRTLDTSGNIVTAKSNWWTSGFFP